MTAIEKGDSNLARKLIEENKDDKAYLDYCDNQNPVYCWTPLMTAIYMDNLEIVKLLIEKGANIHFTNGCGRNALLQAFIYKYNEHQDEIIKLLMFKGATLDEEQLTSPHFNQNRRNKYANWTK